jgi:hypothetical protein
VDSKGMQLVCEKAAITNKDKQKLILNFKKMNLTENSVFSSINQPDARVYYDSARPKRELPSLGRNNPENTQTLTSIDK